MKVTVVGKEYMSGESKKTGKPYSATMVHVTYPKARCEGECVESIWVDESLLPENKIQIGSQYDVDRDARGYLLAFAEV